MTDLFLIQYDWVADLYDSYVQTELDFTFFLEETQKISGNVIELMAGTGRVSIPLVKAGVSLTCVDASEKMLAVLQKKLQDFGLSANIIQANICHFSIDENFQLAILPCNSFSELITPEEQLAALTSIYQCLSPGGRFICTLHNPIVREKTVDACLRLTGQYIHGDSLLLVSGFEKYEGETNIVSRMQFYELYDRQGNLQSKKLLPMRFCLLEKPEFEKLATQTGFQTVALYGDYSRSHFRSDSSPYMIWILQK